MLTGQPAEEHLCKSMIDLVRRSMTKVDSDLTKCR